MRNSSRRTRIPSAEQAFDARLRIAMRSFSTPTYIQRERTREIVLERARQQSVLPPDVYDSAYEEITRGISDQPTVAAARLFIEGIADLIHACLLNDAVYCRAREKGIRVSHTPPTRYNREMAAVRMQFAR